MRSGSALGPRPPLARERVSLIAGNEHGTGCADMAFRKTDNSGQPSFDGTWYPIERGRDARALRANAHKLEIRWPGCYETRVSDGLDTGEFMLSVRHID